MHFNTIALTLGFAASLGAAVPVDASTDTNPRSDSMIFPPPPPPFPPFPPFPYDHGDDLLDIEGLPQPVQDCLKRKPASQEGDPQHPPERPPQKEDAFRTAEESLMPFHKEDDFDRLTVNKICSHGEKKMSSAKFFRRFEKHVFGAIKRCPEVDMQPLENLFWDINVQCHKKWMKQTKAPKDLQPTDAEDADTAEEKDEASSDGDD